MLERILGDLHRRPASATESATESAVGDRSATQSATSRHELFSKNMIPTYVHMVRRTSDRILLSELLLTLCEPNANLSRRSRKSRSRVGISIDPYAAASRCICIITPK